ncbi:hypothetical protein LTR70_009449 [Exophiala xenobiotica]|uniref:Uncharacterized protein n=1 Tax=Lithohypha guttulata TaxID=1690604 RepID=A0ABR0JYM5_9EURO|nr:hypothetical protein LTR24_008986 [Lithohypha guttulata]KAK5310479.1 hypothetical protein LTR70_009449 [Exophiala xenobiotica]
MDPRKTVILQVVAKAITAKQKEPSANQDACDTLLGSIVGTFLLRLGDKEPKEAIKMVEGKHEIISTVAALVPTALLPNSDRAHPSIHADRVWTKASAFLTDTVEAEKQDIQMRLEKNKRKRAMVDMFRKADRNLELQQSVEQERQKIGVAGQKRKHNAVGSGTKSSTTLDKMGRRIENFKKLEDILQTRQEALAKDVRQLEVAAAKPEESTKRVKTG